MSVDVDWEYEDITLERVCLCISSVHFLCLRRSIHLHVIIVKLRRTPAHIDPSACDLFVVSVVSL